MRYITIPHDVVLENLRNPKTGEPPTLGFADFVRGTLVSHPRVTESNDTIKLFREIAETVKGKTPGEEWTLNEEQWELLTNFAKTFQYDGGVKLAILDLVQAITSAGTKSKNAEKSVEESNENGEAKSKSAKDKSAHA